MISQSAQKYLQRMISFSQPKPEEEALSKIHVDYVASRVATLYEKLRQVIDYQEEHLLRKNAIERILKRRLILSRESEEIAQPFIQELIRGGYFPNDRVPEIKIEEIKKILKKYIFLLENLPSQLRGTERNLLSLWLQRLAACEIEETISPPKKETALLDYMTEVMKERVKITNQIPAEEKDLQIFIACQKALLGSDKILISFRLLKYHYPDWLEIQDESLKAFLPKIISFKNKIDREIESLLGKRVFSVVSQYTAPFLVIGDIVSENSKEAQKFFEEPEILEQKIREAYDKRYKTCKAKIHRSSWRSVVSIFLSKVALAFLIEIPFDIFITKKFYLPTLGANFLIPPALMFAIVSSIQAPRAENAPRVVMEAIKVIKGAGKPEIYEIKLPKKRGLFLNVFLGLVYLFISGTIFGLITYGLWKINFSILSIIIFFIFFCLIAFSGIKTQQWARELKVGKEREDIRGFLVDLFFLPFVRVGKWLSGQFQKYNLFILLLNLFFEAPLQTFFEFLEAWRGYIKEKKEEVE